MLLQEVADRRGFDGSMTRSLDDGMAVDGLRYCSMDDGIRSSSMDDGMGNSSVDDGMGNSSVDDGMGNSSVADGMMYVLVEDRRVKPLCKRKSARTHTRAHTHARAQFYRFLRLLMI